MAEPYMTMAEIEAKYPNEWVFIANPKLTKYQEVVGGVVLFHSPDRAEYWRMMEAWYDPDIKHTASWYTGKEPTSDIEWVEPEPGAA